MCWIIYLILLFLVFNNIKPFVLFSIICTLPYLINYKNLVFDYLVVEFIEDFTHFLKPFSVHHSFYTFMLFFLGLKNK